MTGLQTFLLETALRILLEFLTDDNNQRKARNYVKKKTGKLVKGSRTKWDDHARDAALKFFNWDDDNEDV